MFFVKLKVAAVQHFKDRIWITESKESVNILVWFHLHYVHQPFICPVWFPPRQVSVQVFLHQHQGLHPSLCSSSSLFFFLTHPRSSFLIQQFDPSCVRWMFQYSLCVVKSETFEAFVQNKKTGGGDDDLRRLRRHLFISLNFSSSRLVINLLPYFLLYFPLSFSLLFPHFLLIPPPPLSVHCWRLCFVIGCHSPPVANRWSSSLCPWCRSLLSAPAGSSWTPSGRHESQPTRGSSALHKDTQVHMR